ncbi:zinc transporter ZIP9-like [Bolinopsis microptera]|uniref:zinc transporter ZIP9-like n=1 Tax=Bolinopsis microptera TaxID=2820187 RepID=UPI00307A54C7
MAFTEFGQLLLFSISMLIGCFCAGMVPLSMTLSESNLQLMSSLGAGLLVGTALAVIIPEGVTILISSAHQGHSHDLPGGEGLVESQEKEGMLTHDASSSVGMALTCGFIFMLLVDQIGGAHGGHSHTHGPVNSEGGFGKKSLSTIIGLVVHAAADGIALGAASLTDKAEIEFIIFLAIMLHKAPAAFGLTSFLLHEGADRTRVRKVLIIFSVAAPVAAILTFLSLTTMSGGISEYSTGWVMLFSAGTFLYVSTVHVLPEISQEAARTDSVITLSEQEMTIQKSGARIKWTNLASLCCGTFLPVLLNMSHHH